MTPLLRIDRANHRVKLPDHLQLAWLGNVEYLGFARLTETEWAFRPSAKNLIWYIGTLEQLLPIFQSVSIPTPWNPRAIVPSSLPPVDLDDLIKDLDL